MKNMGLKGLWIAGVVLSTLGWTILSGEAASPRPRPLLILPYQGVATGETDSWIGEGVAEALSLAFVHIPTVLPLDRQRVDQATRDTGLGSIPSDDRGLLTLARALHAELVFYGTYRREPGGEITLQPRYLDIKGGEGRSLQPILGPVERLFDLQADLVRSYVRGLQMGLRPDEMEAMTNGARPTTSPVAYEAYVKGRRLASERTRSGLEGAVELFSRAVEVDPAFGIAHYYLGMTNLALGNRWKAAPQFRAASQVDPKLPEPYKALGDLLMTSPRRLYDQAIEAYQKAIALRPHFADAYVGLGDARAAKGDHEGALTEYKRVLAVDSSNAKVHLSMGKIYYNEKGLYYEAVDAYRKAIDLDQYFLEARMGLGEILEEKGLYQDAITEYKKVVEIDPRHTGARYNLAVTYEKVNVKEAIAQWEQYIELASTLPTEKDWLDIARQHLKKLRASERKE